VALAVYIVERPGDCGVERGLLEPGGLSFVDFAGEEQFRGGGEVMAGRKKKAPAKKKAVRRKARPKADPPVEEPPPVDPAEPIDPERVREIQERLREDMAKRQRKSSLRRAF
jgi:hypothetical protein